MLPPFLILGPPGPGKSTLLQHLPAFSKHLTAFDLENVQASPAERLAIMQQLCALKFKGPLFIGCADVNAVNFPQIEQLSFFGT